MDEPTPSEGLLRVRSRLSSKLESDLYFPENRRAATFSSATLRPIIEPEQRGHFCKNKKNNEQAGTELGQAQVKFSESCR